MFRLEIKSQFLGWPREQCKALRFSDWMAGIPKRESLRNNDDRTDPDEHETQWTYNNNGQELTQIDPLGNKTTLVYDNEKRLISQTDADGQKTTYTYDAQNRMATATDVFGITLTYHYDTANHVISRTDSLGGQTSYVYNTNNLETSQQFSGTGLTPLRADFTYTSRSDLSTVKRYSDLVGTILVGSTTYGYDNAERLTGITNTNSGGTLESSYNYSYDTANRVTSEAWTSITATGTLSGTHTTSYDASSQIVSADGANLSYDSNGNRTITGYSTSTDNRLINDGTYTYSYDNVGNRISKVASGTNPDTWVYGYDLNNRLTSVVEKSNGTTVNFTASYVYDVRGDLIQESTWSSTAGNATVKHTYDGTTLLADLNSSLVVQTRYFEDPNGHLLAEEIASTVNWAGVDRLGSLRDMFGTGTTVTAHVEYTGFGVITTNTAPVVAGNVLFQGMYQQAVTGLDVTLHRIYDPVTGRWLTQDPIGFDGGSMNIYEAMGNDQANATDPSGESFVITGVIGGVVGGVWGGWIGGMDGGWKGFVSGFAGGAVAGAIAGSGWTVIGGAVGGAVGSIISQLLNGQDPRSPAGVGKTIIAVGLGSLVGVAGKQYEGKVTDFILGAGEGTMVTAAQMFVDIVDTMTEVFSKIAENRAKGGENPHDGEGNQNGGQNQGGGSLPSNPGSGRGGEGNPGNNRIPGNGQGNGGFPGDGQGNGGGGVSGKKVPANDNDPVEIVVVIKAVGRMKNGVFIPFPKTQPKP